MLRDGDDESGVCNESFHGDQVSEHGRKTSCRKLKGAPIVSKTREGTKMKLGGLVDRRKMSW